MVKKSRSFICILSFSLVLASIFSVGANATYFTLDNIPYNSLNISTPQSYASGVLNDGTKSYAWVQSATQSVDAINNIFLFGVPASSTNYYLYVLFILDNDSSSSSGSFSVKSNSIISGSGLNFSGYYNSSSYSIGYTGTNNFYDTPVLFSYRIVKLFTVDSFSLSSLTNTNFSYQYGNLSYDSVNDRVVRSVKGQFNSVPSFDSLSQEAKDLIDNVFPDHIDLNHSGETTTLVNTSAPNLDPGGDSSPSDATPSDTSTTTGVNVIVSLPNVSGTVFNGHNYNTEFSKIDDLISDLDNMSSVMESNHEELSQEYAGIANNIVGLVRNIPHSVIAVIVCAMIMLICIKVIGR